MNCHSSRIDEREQELNKQLPLPLVLKDNYKRCYKINKFDNKYNGGGGGGGILVLLSMSEPARFGFKAHDTNLAEHKNKIIK